MGLCCGLIGLPYCGKTTIFNAITAARAPMHNGFRMNRVVVNVPDERMESLVAMYHPAKVVPATLEVVDIPGAKAEEDGARSRLLGSVKDVNVLLHVLRCFEDGGVLGGPDPVRDIETVDLELVTADSATLENRLGRLAKKLRSGDEDAIREAASCQKVLDGIQKGIPARKQRLTVQELTSIHECNLVSLKPVLYIANMRTAADAGSKHVQALKQAAEGEGAQALTICGKDEADIAELEPEERDAFRKELGIMQSAMERLLYAAYRGLGLINFFTTGEDEVRAWTCHQRDKAPVAAGKIHSDMESGFIRMEVMRYCDLVELGSETAVAKAGKHRVEGREYEVQDGDIVSVLFNGKG